MIDLNDPASVVAATLRAEDRSGGTIGMHAVANVIGNRAAHPSWWGSDLISVCLARSQFSCWSQERSFIDGLPGDDLGFATALGIADQLVAGNLADITHGSDSYYASNSRKPAWARPPAIYRGVFGGQQFWTVGATGLGTVLGIIAPEQETQP